MIGQSLGPYEIVELLGQGGMGRVYRARDTRLGRAVVIRILPREMSGDHERIARFLVMELVEDEDLSECHGIFVVDLEDEASRRSTRIQVAREGGSRSRWSADDERLHFLSASGGEWMTVNVSGDPARFGIPYMAFASSVLANIGSQTDDTFLPLELSPPPHSATRCG